MLLEQTLHGYDDGHRLLATSTRLHAEEERRLDLLSDLSGYLPRETDFANYLTGYPCGRYYALACTWPDRMGRRSGTVFTQTLLIPKAACAEIEDLGSVLSVFREPAHPVDRALYRQSMDWKPAAATIEPMMTPHARRLLAALWLGQETRPLLWLDALTAVDAARLTWAWMPPWLRQSHTFCTFTLGPRYLGKALFHWMAVARGAEGLFYPIRDRSVRCDGVSIPVGVSPILEAPWISEIATRNSASTYWHEAQAMGFGELSIKYLRVFFRYREFRERSRANYTASLSRIDLLHKLAPTPDKAAEEKRDALWQALRHLERMPAIERPLGLLQQLLERDPATLASALAPEVGGLLAETAEHRLALEKTGDLSQVYTSAKHAGFREPMRGGILAGLQKALDASSTPAEIERWVPLLLAIMDGEETLEKVAQATPTELRRALVRELLARQPDATRAKRATELCQVMTQLGDYEAIKEMLDFLPPESLLGTFTHAQERGEKLPDELLVALLLQLSVDDLFSHVAKIPSTTQLSPAVLFTVVERLLSKPEEADARLEALLGSDVGLRILCAYAERAPITQLDPLLRSNSNGASAILRFAQREPNSKGIERLMSTVLMVVDENHLIDDFDPVLADAWEHSSWATRVCEKIFASVLRRWLSSDEHHVSLRRWLEKPSFQRWLRNDGARRWRSELAAASPEQAPRAMGLLVEPSMTILRQDQYLLESCLRTFSSFRARDIEPLIPAWIQLLTMLPNERDRAQLSAQTLDIVLRRSKAVLAPLAEATFAVVHRELLKDAPHGWLVRKVIGFFLQEDDWDRAGQLRERLAKTWVEEGWPPLSLLRVAQGDVELFDDLARRARSHDGGKKALRRLCQAAQEDPSAPLIWSKMLLRLPGECCGNT